MPVILLSHDTKSKNVKAEEVLKYYLRWQRFTVTVVLKGIGCQNDEKKGK